MTARRGEPWILNVEHLVHGEQLAALRAITMRPGPTPVHRSSRCSGLGACAECGEIYEWQNAARRRLPVDELRLRSPWIDVPSEPVELSAAEYAYRRTVAAVLRARRRELERELEQEGTQL